MVLKHKEAEEDDGCDATEESKKLKHTTAADNLSGRIN